MKCYDHHATYEIILSWIEHFRRKKTNIYDGHWITQEKKLYQYSLDWKMGQMYLKLSAQNSIQHPRSRISCFEEDRMCWHSNSPSLYFSCVCLPVVSVHYADSSPLFPPHFHTDKDTVHHWQSTGSVPTTPAEAGWSNNNKIKLSWHVQLSQMCWCYITKWY